jgi:hypothetical protein
MAPKGKTIDKEWVKSLIGLCMKVPDNWWVGYSTYVLNDGRIHSFDEPCKKWNMLLDTQHDNELYLLNYDAVVEYANKESSTFDEYQLPFKVVLLGDDAYSINGINRFPAIRNFGVFVTS